VKRAWFFLVGFAGVVSWSCGQATPTPSLIPPPPAEIATVAINGVTGVAVVVDGPASAHAGDHVYYTSPGFLSRGTLMPKDGVISLWPLTVDASYVQTIAYQAGLSLYKWRNPAVTITPGVWPPARAEVMSTGAIVLTESSTPDIVVEIKPDDPDLLSGNYAGYARWNSDTFGITHCHISLRDTAYAASNVVVHELGHCLGLNHSLRPSDVMYPAASVPRFTADERVLITMMYTRRRPGNQYPDDDSTLSAQGQGAFSFGIGD
jgi:Matrixin